MDVIQQLLSGLQKIPTAIAGGAGEAEARLVQELFDLGPEFSKVYPPMLMEAELATRGLDSSQLINRANGPLQKVDTDPVVQAILEFARNRK